MKRRILFRTDFVNGYYELVEKYVYMEFIGVKRQTEEFNLFMRTMLHAMVQHEIMSIIIDNTHAPLYKEEEKNLIYSYAQFPVANRIHFAVIESLDHGKRFESDELQAKLREYGLSVKHFISFDGAYRWIKEN